MIKRQDLTEDKIRHAAVCIDHFISGKVTRLQLTMKLHVIVGDMLKSELPFFDVCIANSCRTRSPHLSCSSCCCCCIETSITVPKESAPASPVNQLHHMTNRTNQATRHGLTPSRQPIPDSAIRCRQRRQQYRTCTSHASVRRALPSRAATHNTVTRTRYLLPLCHPDAPERGFTCSGLRPRN